MIKMKLKELSKLLAEFHIPKDITGTCPVQKLKKNKLSYLVNMKYIRFIKPNTGAVILVTPKLFARVRNIKGNHYVKTGNPSVVFLKVHNKLYENVSFFNTCAELPKKGKGCNIDQTAKFGKNVTLGNNVTIFPYTVMGSNITIGDNTVIYPSVSIHDNVVIGRNCIIGSCTVIGGQGFKIIGDENNNYCRLVHIGGVRIGNGVEIGSSSIVDRATFMDTVIEDGVKIDNKVQIGHNVRIGKNSRLGGSCVISGSTVIGKNVWISVCASISDNITIGDDCEILFSAVVVSSLKKGERVSGFYAMPHNSWFLKIKDDYKKYVMPKKKEKR